MRTFIIRNTHYLDHNEQIISEKCVILNYTPLFGSLRQMRLHTMDR